MRAGLRLGRIITTDPGDRPASAGARSQDDAFYVYRRTGEPCRICATPVVMETLSARKLSLRAPFCP